MESVVINFVSFKGDIISNNILYGVGNVIVCDVNISCSYWCFGKVIINIVVVIGNGVVIDINILSNVFFNVD